MKNEAVDDIPKKKNSVKKENVEEGNGQVP